MQINTLAAASAWLSVFAIGTAAFANPSTKDPHAVLDVHGGEIARKLHTEAASLYASALEAIKSYEAADKGNRLGRMKGQEIGQMRVNLARINRLGRQLSILGEPSGPDFVYRAGEMIEYEYFTRKWPSLPTSARYMTSVRVTFERQGQQREAAVEKIRKMIAEEKWQAAHDELYRILDGLWVGGYLLTAEEQKRYFAVFGEVQGAIDAAMDRIRSETARTVLTQSRQEQTPDFASTLAQMQRAVQDVATSGQTDWNGEVVTGPQLVTKIGETWRDAHVATLRCTALDWALAARSYSSDVSALETPATPARLNDAYRQFSDAVLQTLAALVEGESSRVAGDAAVTLYVEYLGTLAPWLANVSGEHGWDGVQQALNRLAAKAPGFAEDVAAYDAGSRELLRWRARAAAGLAASKSGGAKPLATIMRDATLGRPGYAGLFPSVGQTDAPPRLMSSAPRTLIPATERLVGQAASARNAVRIPGARNSAIARYEARVYGILAPPGELAGEIEALKFDLQVSDAAPPLTLRTAVALTRAERGDFAAVGGETQTAYLEGLITRFASLPSAASVLLPLDATPNEPAGDYLYQMLLRFDLQPRWLQNEHFFVELAPAAPQ